MFTACSDAANTTGLKCHFSYSDNGVCEFDQSKVSLLLEPIADDEKLITGIIVERNNKTHQLKLAEETILLTGDMGVILSDDINFDGFEDLAISTSFGLANLYLDYWIFDAQSQVYKYVGNYSKFSLDIKSKTVSSRVKHNAAKVELHHYRWHGNNLVKFDK